MGATVHHQPRLKLRGELHRRWCRTFTPVCARARARARAGAGARAYTGIVRQQ